MRLRIAREDSPQEEIEVDLEGKVVRLRGRSYPFEVVEDGPTRVTIEIAGERVVVDGWPRGFAAPPGPVAVNGESETVTAVEREAGAASEPLPRPVGGRPGAGSAPAAPGGAPAADPRAGPGTPILPPMPGKLLEVRVREGDRVAAGDVLVVVEAMKMRNEIASPVAGTVAGLSARAGANVRAREVLMRIVPDA
ncbi:MAG: biotin/lipoyl-containing protein [Thermoplasmata archaeon]